MAPGGENRGWIIPERVKPVSDLMRHHRTAPVEPWSDRRIQSFSFH
jgi:hypothetical protein